MRQRCGPRRRRCRRACRTRPASPPASARPRRPLQPSLHAAQDSAAAASASLGLAERRRPAAASAFGVPIAAIRRAMNGSSCGHLARRRPVAAPRSGRPPASGSAAYQYISGRLWSAASSACASKPASDLRHRRSIGSRCKADARYRRTTGDGSACASSVERRPAASGRATPVFERELNRPGPHVLGVGCRRGSPRPSRRRRARRRRAAPTARSRRVAFVVVAVVRQPARSGRGSPSRRCWSAARSCRIRRAWRTYQSFSCSLVARPAPRRVHFCRSTPVDRLRAAVADLVDAAVGPVPDLRVVVVAGLLVVPVDQVDVAVRAVPQVDEPRPVVVRQQEVRAVAGDVAAALRLRARPR